MRTLAGVAGLAVVVAFGGCTTATKVVIDGVTYSCSNAPQFTVVHTPSHLTASPDCVYVKRNDMVSITFRNPIGAGKARTKGGSSWLNHNNGEGNNSQQITITVDGNAHGPYKFTLEVDGTGTLDPRIVVE